jgi:hypothetical protein
MTPQSPKPYTPSLMTLQSPKPYTTSPMQSKPDDTTKSEALHYKPDDTTSPKAFYFHYKSSVVQVPRPTSIVQCSPSLMTPTSPEALLPLQAR